MASEDPVMKVINKRLRALKKKLNRIIKTELSVNRGQKINPQQEKLLCSKPDVVARMDELTKLLQLICDYSKEDLSLSHTTPQADEIVNQTEHSSSSALSDIGMEVQSGSSMVASSSSCGLSPPLRIDPVLQSFSCGLSSSSSYEDMTFVVHSRMSGYIVKAFETSTGELNPNFCFRVHLYTTHLPHHCGFGAVGSTLYMIEGCIRDKLASTYVTNLVTYKIDFCKIPQFPNQSIPPDFGDLVQPGPLLHARKDSPIVIVVGNKIHVFNRFLLVKEESPRNFECLSTEAQEWELLPEPPFKKGPGKGIFRHYEIESYVVEEDFIVIRITGEGTPGMFKLNIHDHEWSAVNPNAVKFSGKGVSLNNMYYALMDRCIDHMENRVVCFRSPLSSEVDEVADIQPYPGEVRCLRLSEFASMGASIFIARTGHSYVPDPTERDPPHYLSVEKIEVSIVAGKSKAIKSRTQTFELDVSDSVLSVKSLYIVRWVRSG